MQNPCGFNISGIQQVGVGTENFRKSWNWFIRMFGTDVKILEDDTVAERMLPYTGNQPQKRHACIAVNLQGGGGFEIWQYSERKPQPVGFRHRRRRPRRLRRETQLPRHSRLPPGAQGQMGRRLRRERPSRRNPLLLCQGPLRQLLPAGADGLHLHRRRQTDRRHGRHRGGRDRHGQVHRLLPGNPRLRYREI